MSESFVKTFKRDFVRCNPRQDAQTVLDQLDQLDRWFEDYDAVPIKPPMINGGFGLV